MIDEERLIEDFANNYLVKNDGTWNDAMDRAVELAKTAPKIGGWIPCSERMPEEEGTYLVTRPNFGNWITDTMYFCRGSFTDNHVRAWKPLPDPYTEKQKE